MNPPDKKRLPSSPDDWLMHARSDLKLAQLGRNSDVLPEQICFHAQQAAEKAIKAVLLSARIDFPLTHDLEELLETLEQAGVNLPDNIREAGILTPYAVESRYPGYWGEIAEADVAEALSLAERVETGRRNIARSRSPGTDLRHQHHRRRPQLVLRQGFSQPGPDGASGLTTCRPFRGSLKYLSVN